MPLSSPSHTPLSRHLIHLSVTISLCVIFYFINYFFIPFIKLMFLLSYHLIHVSLIHYLSMVIIPCHFFILQTVLTTRRPSPLLFLISSRSGRSFISLHRDNSVLSFPSYFFHIVDTFHHSHPPSFPLHLPLTNHLVCNLSMVVITCCHMLLFYQEFSSGF